MRKEYEAPSEYGWYKIHFLSDDTEECYGIDDIEPVHATDLTDALMQGDDCVEKYKEEGLLNPRMVKVVFHKNDLGSEGEVVWEED